MSVSIISTASNSPVPLGEEDRDTQTKRAGRGKEAA